MIQGLSDAVLDSHGWKQRPGKYTKENRQSVDQERPDQEYKIVRLVSIHGISQDIEGGGDEIGHQIGGIVLPDSIYSHKIDKPVQLTL